MTATNPVTFVRFRLDPPNERLWRGVEAIPLRPKAFAVLSHLVQRRGELVTKQQLLEAVWPDTFVGDAVLKDCIRQLREALSDDAASPRYIETAHRRGYRFIGNLTDESASVSAPSGSSAVASLLGRSAELATMQRWLERAAAGEAYLPVLDGLSRLAQRPEGERIVAFLRQHAPQWLIELPALLSASDREVLQRQLAGGTRVRPLRDLAEAIEAIAADCLLIVVLEDLHWSDQSTLDLVAYLARRRDPARLLLIGTYRPVDVILGDHPLRRLKPELQAHGLCHELPLEYLDHDAIAQYVDV